MRRDEPRSVATGGDAYGTHRVLEPRGALPQPALRVDNDFTRLFEGEVLLAVETLNIDAASFTQMEKEGDPAAHRTTDGGRPGKAAQPGDGLGRDAPRAGAADRRRKAPGRGALARGRPGGDARLALAHAASHRPRAAPSDRPARRWTWRARRCSSPAAPTRSCPADLPERLALAALDVAGAAPQVARLVEAGGRRGRARRRRQERHPLRRRGAARGGPGARVVGLEASPRAADELRALGLCDAVVAVDARDPVAVRRAVLGATGGREADVTFSCVNVPDAELGAILATRDRGVVYFFAMSTSFTKAALGAEGVGKDVDLFIGNGYAHGHAEHTLAMLRDMPRCGRCSSGATARDDRDGLNAPARRSGVSAVRLCVWRIGEYSFTDVRGARVDALAVTASTR